MGARVLLFVAGVIALLLATAVHAPAVNATDTLTVSVIIKQKAIVDINPASFVWSGVGGEGLEPGEEGEEKAIQIENLGSVNITYIWFNNSYPSENPFGTGDVSKYDSGNWVVIRKNQTGEKYYFPGRMEYRQPHETYPIIYLTLPANWVSYGRFRNGSAEYFWALVNGTANCTDGTLYLGTEPHTKDQTGDTDLTDNDHSITNVNGIWGVTAVNIGGSMPMCAAVHYTCDKIYFYHWNMDAPGATTCSNAEYFLDGATDTPIVPGASAYANINVRVPYGVPYDVSGINGTLTVLVSTE